MILYRAFLLFVTIFCCCLGLAQDKYWVFFTDKDGVSFDPFEYFDGKAIERRVLHGIPLCHFTDFPVKESYVEQVSLLVDSSSYVTRWFNALAVYASPEQLTQVKRLLFVKQVEPMIYQAVLTSGDADYDTSLTENKRDLLKRQTERMGLADFEARGIDGKGIRVAIFDAGFPTVDTNPAFEHIRKEGRIIKTYDFVKKKENVYKFASHGTMVMSCVGGMINGKKIGMATGAEFLLARTEMGLREPFAEEEYWLAAAEWADKNGAHIINSSLAYTYHRYFIEDMDGKKSLVARAANMAASKGILVVNAAGNDGDGKWKKIATPADADSVLTVGGINPDTDFHQGFSSYGPTANKKMKPNVAAFSKAITAGKNGLEVAHGTSFASPLVAGFAACALQASPGMTNMELFSEIEKSADLYPYFDYAHGYGVPQASWFVNGREKPKETFEFVASKFMLKIRIKDEFRPKSELESISGILEEYLKNAHKYLYYHIENEKGYLDKYYVLEVTEQEPLRIYLDDYKKGQKLRVHYKGYTSTYDF